MSLPAKRIHVVINPASGKGVPVLKHLADVCREHGVEWDVSITHEFGDAARQAREALVASRADLFPSLSASGSYSRSEPLRGGSTTQTLSNGQVVSTGAGGRDSFSLGLDASYQVDLFGGVRSGIAIGVTSRPVARSSCTSARCAIMTPSSSMAAW